MGIKGLFAYISQLEGSFKTVNIAEEIRRYRKEKNEKPVIVINLWSFIKKFQENLHDALFGCRYNQVKADFEDFLIRLRENGAVLVFLMKKSQTREADFLKLSDNYYAYRCEAYDVIETLKSTSKIVRHFEKPRKCGSLLNQTTAMVLAQTASKYGKIYGMDTLNQKASTVHVQIAEKHKALAIIGTDTYYIFYEGPWKFWCDDSLDMRSMTIREFKKEFILNNLGITFAQAPLFVTLTGGLYTSFENIKKIYHFFKPWNDNLFTSVPLYVNKQNFPVTDESLALIVEEIFGRNDEKIVEEFRRTIDLMNTNFEPKLDSRIERNIMDNFENEFVSFANFILTNSPISIPPIDLRKYDLQPVTRLVIDWIKKTAGIIQKNQNVVEQLKLVVKTKHREPTHLLLVDVIFPDFEIPSLTEIVYGESNDRAHEFLLWICSDLRLSADIAESIPDEHLCNFILLAHLIRKRSLKMFEAKLILKTIADVESGKVPENVEYPDIIDERAIRVNTLFSTLYYILHACLGSIGVKKFQTDFKFDSAWFYKNYEESKCTALGNEYMSNVAQMFSEFEKIVDC